VLLLAGSSQRMMQGLVLDAAAPLYGRARETIQLRPLRAGWMSTALGMRRPVDCVRAYSAWGGVPWYWELAERFGADLECAVDELILDPMSPLHSEPDRLLLEELPSAATLRPLLDAIGAGAHRLSEIAGRIGQPATSLSRPLVRLVELGLVRREQPFGEHERAGKRALYRIDDPFFRLWFRVVAPHRGQLAASASRARRVLWRRHVLHLQAQTWEELCREAVPLLDRARTGAHGPFQPAARYWRGGEPEWDVVAASADDKSLLLGECKWFDGPVDQPRLDRLFRGLMAKGLPGLAGLAGRPITHALFVPDCPARLKRRKAPYLVFDADDVLDVLR
jgi:AAA+ ATPase superfamily predicted ATPase